MHQEKPASKKILFFFSLLVFFITSCSENKNQVKDEMRLRNDFQQYLEAIGEKKLSRVSEYTWPKLSTILPSEAARKYLLNTVLLEDKNVDLEAVALDTVYPVFFVEKTAYAKAYYSIVLSMKNADTVHRSSNQLRNSTGTNHLIAKDHYPAPQSTLLATIISGDLNAEVVSAIQTNGSLRLELKRIAVAVREGKSNWTFFTVGSDQELINKIFPRIVLEKLVVVE